MTIGLSTIERHKPGKPARDPRSLDERGGPTRAPPPKPPTPPQRTTAPAGQRPTAPPTGQRTTTGQRPTASTTAPTAPTTSSQWTAQDYAVAGGVVALIGVIAWSIYK